MEIRLSQNLVEYFLLRKEGASDHGCLADPNFSIHLRDQDECEQAFCK